MIRQVLSSVWKSFTHTNEISRKSFTETERRDFEDYKRIEHVRDADIWPPKLKYKIKE